MIVINDQYHIDRPREEDAEALVEYLNDPEIYRNTLKIPRPYRLEDGITFINACQEFNRQHGFFKDQFIRDTSGACIGGIGLLYDWGIQSHKSEIGYWLGRPFWGQGIMTAAVRRFSNWAFSDRKLVRLSASVYTHNPASCRVLEKAGYEFEGILRADTKKGNEYFDVKLYARIRPNIEKT